MILPNKPFIHFQQQNYNLFSKMAHIQVTCNAIEQISWGFSCLLDAKCFATVHKL